MPPETAAGPEAAWLAVARLFGGEPDTLGEAGDGGLPPAIARRIASTEPERLEAEYVRLFVNAVPEVPCPPYASVYLEGTLYGEETRRIRELYRKWGVDTDEVPDHLAVEAAFLAGLGLAAGQDPEAAADRDRLLDHLRAWTPPFLDAVETHDRTGVFAATARWVRSLLDEEAGPNDA